MGESLASFREIEVGCAHLCGWRRASSVLDSTVRAALELGGWTVRGLAKAIDVSPALIQKRAGRWRPGGVVWSRRVSWIGDNTGRLRQVARCGRCPETREFVY